MEVVREEEFPEISGLKKGECITSRILINPKREFESIYTICTHVFSSARSKGKCEDSSSITLGMKSRDEDETNRTWRKKSYGDFFCFFCFVCRLAITISLLLPPPPAALLLHLLLLQCTHLSKINSLFSFFLRHTRWKCWRNIFTLLYVQFHVWCY